MDSEDPSLQWNNIGSKRWQAQKKRHLRYFCWLSGTMLLVTATLIYLNVSDITLLNLSPSPTKEWWGRVHVNFSVNISGTSQKAHPGLTNATNVTYIFPKTPKPKPKDVGTYSVAYPRRYRFILDEPDACHTESPFVVLMVPVAPQEWVARDAIRRTWGKERVVLGKKVLLFFMLGLPGGVESDRLQKELHREREVHHDLLQGSFRDAYFNLTIKTIMIQEWIVSRCPGAPYGMKIDSDMFLNVQNLVKMLKAFPKPQHDYITGMLTKNGPVVRDPRSKWYLPLEVYPDPTFPSYPLGMGYVFSTDLSQKIVDVSKQMNPVYIEDAHLGMCLKRLGISPTNPPSLSLFKVYQPKPYNRCHYAKAITTILDSPKMLISYWEDLQKPGPPC